MLLTSAVSTLIRAVVSCFGSGFGELCGQLKSTNGGLQKGMAIEGRPALEDDGLSAGRHY